MAERRGHVPRYEEIRFDAVGVTLDRARPVDESSTSERRVLAGELELRVRHRLERAPVQRRDPDLLDRRRCSGVE